MTKPYITHEDATVLSLQRDPQFAAEYLNAVLEDGDQEELIMALLRLADAFGTKQASEIAQINLKAIYNSLSLKNNPELKLFQTILSSMGMRLAITANHLQHGAV